MMDTVFDIQPTDKKHIFIMTIIVKNPKSVRELIVNIADLTQLKRSLEVIIPEFKEKV